MAHIMVLRLAVAASLSIASIGTAQASGSEGPLVVQDKNDGDKMKCRKVEVTGSLVKKGKVCRTIAEWRLIQQNGNDTARIMLGEQICSGGECRGN